DEQTLRELGCFDKRRNGAGTISAVAAIYLAARTATRPSAGLLRAAFLPKADTDTLASMTASLLGALHGPDWTDELNREVQDARYLHDLADRLSALPFRPKGPRQEALDEMPRPATAVRAAEIKRFRDASFGPHSVPPTRFPDGRVVEHAKRD